MNRRTRIAALAIAGTTALGGLAIAVSPALQGERELDDRKLKKVHEALAEWLTAVDEGDERFEPEGEFRDELDKFNDRTLKGGDLLSYPADLGYVLYMANDYRAKERDIKRAIGKVSSQEFERGPRTIEYAIWTPENYRSQNGPYPLVLTIPDEVEDPEEHLTRHWMNTPAAETAVIACPKMPGNSDAWNSEGLAAAFLTMAGVQRSWAIDVDRVFVGGRGRGGEFGVSMANKFPKQFTGAFAWASDAGEGIEPLNLKHVPVYIAGGGSEATAYQERAKEAGVDSVTLDATGDAASIAAWMSDKVRAAYPTDVTVIPGETFPLDGYWLSFDPVPSGSEARVDGTYDPETNSVTITSKGVTEVTLYLSDAMLDLSKPVTVVANGAEVTKVFDRSVTQFLGFIESSKNDPGRIFVAADKISVPALEEGGD